MTQGSTPPGWYPDGQGAQRWWDGQQWTEHTQPAAPAQATPPAQAPQPAQPAQPAFGQQPAWGQQPGWPGYPGAPAPRKKTGLIVGAALGAAALVAAVVVVLVLVVGGDDDSESSSRDDDSSASEDSSSSASDDPFPDPEPSAEVPTFDGAPASDGPEATVEQFFDAASQGDCDTASALVTQDFLDEQGGCDPDEFNPGDTNDLEWVVQTAAYDGDDSASVPVTVSQVDEDTREAEFSVDFAFELTNESGTWLIEDYDISDPSSAPTS